MKTLQRIILTTISVLSLTLLSGCIFDTVEDKQIIGPYFLIAVDLPENMCIVYNEKEDHSGGGDVKSGTWLYDNSTQKVVQIFALNFDFYYELAKADSMLEGDETPVLNDNGETEIFKVKTPKTMGDLIYKKQLQ